MVEWNHREGRSGCQPGNLAAQVGSASYPSRGGEWFDRLQQGRSRLILGREHDIRLHLRGFKGVAVAKRRLEAGQPPGRRSKRRQVHKLPLTIPQILAWADAHHRRTGKWPSSLSGPVGEAAGETWGMIDSALCHGLRSLSAGSSLRKLLAEQRGFRARLTIEQVLAWADAHRERTGEWPSVNSGAVHGAAGERWQAIDRALRRGSRGLPGGSSLAMLLDERRGPRANLVGRPTAARRALRLRVS